MQLECVCVVEGAACTSMFVDASRMGRFRGEYKRRLCLSCRVSI
jgi:hypothetical protein